MATNTQSKSLPMMFLLGAFLTGGALGFVADRAIAATKPQSSSASNELARRLNLTEAQQLAIDSIMKWRSAQNREDMKPIEHLLIANRDSARVLIKQRLDAKQVAEFDQMIEESRIKAAEKRQKQQSSQ